MVDPPSVRRNTSQTLLGLIEEAFPKITVLVKARGCDDLLEPLATELVTYTKATSKFIEFTLNFMPEPPVLRPAPAFQFKFSKRNLRDALSKIYGYRSKALHSGIPFPYPMCEAPRNYDETRAVQEVMIGLAAHTRNASWNRHDLCPAVDGSVPGSRNH